MEELLTMTTRELDKLRVIRQVLERKLRWREAAGQLMLSTRQIARLCRRVESQGNEGIIHRLRSRASNHQLTAGRLAKALELVRTRYPDFGPTFANEKLREHHQLILSTWTLRQGMIAGGFWRPRHQKVTHRAWRARRTCVGELVQLDGSDHAWFEDRAPRCALVIYIDDATSRILHGEFVAVEDTLTLLRTTQTYLKQHGRPLAFYVDKDSIYRVNRQATIEEELQESAPLTQFTRAMRELGIEVICAHSPQAKGRVERSFDTHQDRLVKELRLAQIRDKERANRFLRERYVPAHNRHYAVEPANPTDAHRPLLVTHDLDAILSIQTTRTIERDFTLRWQNRFFQLGPEQPVRLRPGDTVLIEQRLEGLVHLRAKGRYLAATPIAKRAPRPSGVATLAPGVFRRPRRPYHPPRAHPWRVPGPLQSGGTRLPRMLTTGSLRCLPQWRSSLLGPLRGHTLASARRPTALIHTFTTSPPLPQTPTHDYDYDISILRKP